ncbi:ATP-binding protein [Crocinitomicaceae bacterium]|nr:ATP-binding protein [Crocinitomicaceae bacterium]
MSKDQKTSKFALGFSGFRKFEDFPILEFGEITYLVGRNNAGKSTLVKALVLVFEYLKNQQNETFNLDSDIIDNINIPNFGRAVTYGSNSNYIDFTLHLGEWECDIVIKGEKHQVSAGLSDVQIHNNRNRSRITYNFDSYVMDVTFAVIGDASNNTQDFSHVEKQIRALGKELSKLDLKSREGIQTLHKYNTLKERLHKEKYTNKPVKKSIFLTQNLRSRLNDTTGKFYTPDLDERYSEFQQVVKQELELLKNKGRLSIESPYASMPSEKGEDLGTLISDRELFLTNLSTPVHEDNQRFFQKLRDSNIHAISAIPSKQSTLYLIREKENSLAQIIHTIYNQKHLKGSKQNLFIKKWMSLFEIGEDYQIDRISDEAYEFKVITKDKLMHLCDKGTGSMQAMMIILKIASLIKSLEQKNNELGYEEENLKKFIRQYQGEMIVLLEEPEVNLHPALQSLLTQFFHDVNKEYKLKFIIETHSEYAIRKSQVLVKKEEYTDGNSLNPNPFKTYYFPTDDVPYEMIYRPDGKFENSFKSGFFDINADLATDLL